MKHVWKRLMAVLLVLAMLMPMLGMAEEAAAVYGVCLGGTEGGDVKVRKTAGGNGVWFEIPKGHVAEILGETTKDGTDWYKINCTHPNGNGRFYIGYIMAKYFRVMTAAEVEDYLGGGEVDDSQTPEDSETNLPADEEDTEHVEYSGTEVTGAKGKVTANANFRSQPTTKSGHVLAVIPSGTEVEITAIPTDEDDGWYRVRYNDQPGYVYCTLLTVTEPGEAVEPEELTGAKGEVTADDVRLRAEASTSADILCQLDEGTEVELLTIPDQISVDDWYKVRYNGQVGYIQSNFIRVTDTGDQEKPAIIGTGKVTGNGVNFRSGPATSYSSYGKLAYGTEVELVTIPEGTGSAYWFEVYYDGQRGYIQSTYVKILTQEETDTPEDEGDSEPTVSTGMTTSASGVNFRMGPGTSYSNYGKLPEGTVVELLSIPGKIDEDHWYKVRYNNKVGYIMSTFIRVLHVNEEDLPETDYGYAKLIKTSGVNLRATAGGTVMATWSGKGSLMRVVGEAVSKGLYSWYPVYHVGDSTIYYVRDDMVEIVWMEDGEIVTPPAAGESAYGYVITTNSGVNLRIKPGEHVITEIPRNTVLTCVAEPQSPAESGTSYWWYKVSYNGSIGYVRGDMVRVCTATGGEIVGDDEEEGGSEEDPSTSTTVYGYIRLNTGNRVHLRKTAGGDSWGTLADGTVLPVMGEMQDAGLYSWYPVRDADNRFGWIRSDCAVVCDAEGNEVEDGEITPPEEEEPDLVGATAKITTNTNFRRVPDASDKETIITVIPSGTVVTVLQIPENTSTGWYKISYGGETGYVYGKYVKMLTMGEEGDGSEGETEPDAPSAFGYVMVTGNQVYVRKTAGGTPLTQVNTGTVWPIIGTSVTYNGAIWFNINADGHKGYIHSDYAFKLSAAQEESYLAGNGVPEEVPDAEETPSEYLITVDTNKLNVRESYSQDSASVAQVAKGTVMQFFGTKKVGTATWYNVLYDHRERWVHGDYAEVMTQAEYDAWAAANPDLAPDKDDHLGYLRTNQNGCYVRNAADGSVRVDKIAAKGTVIRYYTKAIPVDSYSWYRILTPAGEFAYIRSDLVEKCDENGDDLPIPTPDLGDLSSAPQSQQETAYSTLKQGDGGEGTDEGRKVANLVQELINQGYYTGELTYNYTSEVAAAVKAFQTVKGLDVDGVAGSATQHALFGTVPYGAGKTDNLEFSIYPVEKIDWFTGGIQQMIPRGSNFKVYDVKTGIVWWAHRWAGAYHADIETLTAADSERLCEIYGVSSLKEIVEENMWQRRPCLVTIGTRTFACSLDGMQHNPDGDTISNNGMDGQICLHFTNSTSHGDPPVVSTTHAEAIEYAYNNCPAGKK